MFEFIQYYTIIDYWGIGHDVMSAWEYQYCPRRIEKSEKNSFTINF